MSEERIPTASLLLVDDDGGYTLPECHSVPGALAFDGECHLGAAFCSAAMRNAAAPAISTASRQWSYGQLLRAARVVAGRLLRHPHFHAGDRLLLLLPNGAEYAAVF